MIDGPGRRSRERVRRMREQETRGSEVTPPSQRLDKCSITMSASLLIACEGKTQTFQASLSMIQSIVAYESITDESDESLIIDCLLMTPWHSKHQCRATLLSILNHHSNLLNLCYTLTTQALVWCARDCCTQALAWPSCEALPCVLIHVCPCQPCCYRY